MTFTLTAQPRSERGKKLKALRAKGLLPAVVYGPKEATTPMNIDLREFKKMYEEAGESTIVVLKGLDDDKEVLIHDVAYDPVFGNPIHVDFYAIERGKKLTVDVELVFVGEAPAVKTGGGVITKVLHELEVECLPRNLPQHIDVDLSGLTEIDQQIHVKNIVLPEGVEALNDPDDVVVVVSEVKEEVEEEPTAIDMDAIQVEKKGKEEDAEGAPADTENA